MCFERLEYDADVNIITTWDYRMHGPARSQKQQRNRSALRRVVDEYLNQETTEHADVDELTEQLGELLVSTKEDKVFEEKNTTSVSPEEQGAPSKAIRDVVLHNAGLSRQNRTSLSQEDKKQKRKKAKKKSKLVIVDELGLSRPVQQRALSDEAKSLLNETL